MSVSNVEGLKLWPPQPLCINGEGEFWAECLGRKILIIARIPGHIAACRSKMPAGAAVAELFIATISMPNAVMPGRWVVMLDIACIFGVTKDLVNGSTSGIRIRQELLASGHG